MRDRVDVVAQFAALDEQALTEERADVQAAVASWQRALHLLDRTVELAPTSTESIGEGLRPFEDAIGEADAALERASRQSTEDADAKLATARSVQRDARRALLVVVLLVVLAGAVARRVLLGSVLRPVDALLGAVGSLRSGGRPDVAAGGARELRILAHAFNDMSAEVARSHEELVQRALTDNLTGLANRAAAIDRLDRALDRHHGGALPPAVLLLDLDGFKEVNDTAGHDAGDSVLISAAGRLRQVVRGDDALIRFGGDEFVVVTAGSDPEGLPSLAERIVRAFDEPFQLEGRSMVLSASVGVATAAGQPEVSAVSLIRDADLAMYEAKRGGGGRWRSFEPTALEGAVATAVSGSARHEAGTA